MKNSLIVNTMKTVVSAILGIILLNVFNIFDYLSFVPSKFKYEVGMTTYFSIIELAILAIINNIDEKYYTKVECIFYNKRNWANSLENPIINFSEDVAQISVKISAVGNSSQLRKNSILLMVPEWITIQTNSNIVMVADDAHSCVLELSRIVPDSGKSERVAGSADLLFIRDSKDQASYSLTGQLKGSDLCKKIKCNFVSNCVEIKP